MNKNLLISFLFCITTSLYAQILSIQCNEQVAPLNPLSATNLISNGSFEQTDCAFAEFFCPNSTGANCDITDWTCTGGGSSTYAQMFNSTISVIPHGNLAAYFGNYFANLCSDDFGDVSCMDFVGCTIVGIPPDYPTNTTYYGGSTGVSLSQTVDGLTVGDIYVLEFWGGGEGGSAVFPDPGIFSVDIGFGGIFLNCLPTDPFLDNTGKRFMITFQATGTSHTIKFTNWGHVCATCTELVLDDVKLYPLLEATTTPPDALFHSFCFD